MFGTGTIIWNQYFYSCTDTETKRWALLLHSVAAVFAIAIILAHIYAGIWIRLRDPSTIFEARTKRLADVAVEHPLEAYLLFLSGVVAMQHAAHAALPPARPLARQRIDGPLPAAGWR